jgi:hypothetical protein
MLEASTAASPTDKGSEPMSRAELKPTSTPSFAPPAPSANISFVVMTTARSDGRHLFFDESLIIRLRSSVGPRDLGDGNGRRSDSLGYVLLPETFVKQLVYSLSKSPGLLGRRLASVGRPPCRFLGPSGTLFSRRVRHSSPSADRAGDLPPNCPARRRASIGT